MNIERVINFFFTLQINLKLYHWQTTSHARHVASNREKIHDHIDRFMEVYIGKYGRSKMDSKQKQIKLENFSDDTIISFLKEAEVFINTISTKMLHSVRDSDLINILDELKAELNQILYLFTLK
jgi:hypothetical protein